MSSPAEALIQNAFEKINAPSMIGAIIHHGQLQYVLETGDATRTSQFRLGTLTQALTAYAILHHLTPEQRHQPITTWLKAFDIQSPAPITPHHLLTHTSGIGTARSLAALVKNDAIQPADKPIPELSVHYRGTLKAQIEAGGKWCYSHDNYAVLGQLLADMHNKPYSTLMDETVFQPLNMQTTFNTPTLDGYKTNRQTIIQQTSPLLGALGACASLDDLIQFVGALFQSPMLYQPYYQTHPHLPAMGYGLRLQAIDQTKLAWLNGQMAGFSGALCLEPDSQTAVILLANMPTESLLGSVARQAVLNVLNRTPSAPQPAPNQPNLRLKGYYAPSAGLLTNIEVWNAYGGGVNIHQKGGQVKISAQIDPTRHRPLIPTIQPDLYYFTTAKNQPSWVAIGFAPDGTAQHLHIGLFTFYRRPFYESLGMRLLFLTFLLLTIFFIIILLSL
jgi:CubicO group peptidase (beta-lactamase class C family)